MSSNTSSITIDGVINNSNSKSRGANSGSSQQACAVCKYQRRKCTPGCALAPYFPADRQRQFLNAHKLFGVSNMLKIIKNLDPPQRDEAMRSMIYQADVRANDPVGGCYRMIHDLQLQIERDKAELQCVLQQLAIYRTHTQVHMQFLQQQQQEAINNNHTHIPDSVAAASYVTTTPMLPPPPHHHLQPEQYSHQELGYLMQDSDNHQHHHHQQGIQNQWILQHDPPNPNRIDNDPEASSSMHVNKEPFINECEDRPLLGMFEDRHHSLSFDHKDSMQCSDKSGQKEEEVDSVVLKGDNNLMEHVPEHDLKGAASLFTLTNCNR